MKRACLREFLPWSLAVIALSVAAVLISYKGIDAWRDGSIKPDDIRTVSLAGIGVVHVAPDTVYFEISIYGESLRETVINRFLREKAELVLDCLRDALAPGDVIRTEGPSMVDSVGATQLLAYRGRQTIHVRATSMSRGLAAYQMLEALADPALQVSAPRCMLEDKRAAGRQAEEEAWNDLQRQLDNVRNRTSLALGPAVDVATASPPIEPVDETWPCESGFAVQTTVAVTYSVR